MSTSDPSGEVKPIPYTVKLSNNNEIAEGNANKLLEKFRDAHLSIEQIKGLNVTDGE